jgi:hypothetical protein
MVYLPTYRVNIVSFLSRDENTAVSFLAVVCSGPPVQGPPVAYQAFSRLQ